MFFCCCFFVCFFLFFCVFLCFVFFCFCFFFLGGGATICSFVISRSYWLRERDLGSDLSSSWQLHTCSVFPSYKSFSILISSMKSLSCSIISGVKILNMMDWLDVLIYLLSSYFAFQNSVSFTLSPQNQPLHAA